MAAAKINQFVRQSVAADLMERAFMPRIQAWLDNARALHKEVYERLYSPKVQKLMAQIEAERGKSFERSSYLQLNIGGLYRRVDTIQFRNVFYNMPDQFIPMRDRCIIGEEELPVCGGRDRLDLTTDDDLAVRLDAHFNEDANIQTDITEKYNVLRATLLKFKTMTQVQDHWAEIVPVFEKYLDCGIPKTEIMSIPFADLNALFHLPPEETTDALETSGVAA